MVRIRARRRPRPCRPRSPAATSAVSPARTARRSRQRFGCATTTSTSCGRNTSRRMARRRPQLSSAAGVGTSTRRSSCCTATDPIADWRRSTPTGSSGSASPLQHVMTAIRRSRHSRTVCASTDESRRRPRRAVHECITGLSGRSAKGALKELRRQHRVVNGMRKARTTVEGHFIDRLGLRANSSLIGSRAQTRRRVLSRRGPGELARRARVSPAIRPARPGKFPPAPCLRRTAARLEPPSRLSFADDPSPIARPTLAQFPSRSCVRGRLGRPRRVRRPQSCGAWARATPPGVNNGAVYPRSRIRDGRGSSSACGAPPRARRKSTRTCSTAAPR